MELLDRYMALQNEIFDYFGYVEDWRVLPLDDERKCFWTLIESGRGEGVVRFAGTEEELLDGAYFEDEVYTQRHLDRWIYRGAEYTMIALDTNTGNQLLRVFTNANERKG